MNVKKTEEFLNGIKDILNKPYKDSGSKLSSESICKLEMEFFEYFLENDIETLFILFTPAIFPTTGEMALCVSFSNPQSFQLFRSKWIDSISDGAGIRYSIRKKPNSNEFTGITVVLFGNSLYNFESLLLFELETYVFNHSAD